MRPSLIRFSRASLAISRRTGSNDEISTIWGDSSTSSVTPVAASNALMLRPSRPMMRPFISSPGSWTMVAVMSLFGRPASPLHGGEQNALRLLLQFLLGLLEHLAPERPDFVLALERHLLAQRLLDLRGIHLRHALETLARAAGEVADGVARLLDGGGLAGEALLFLLQLVVEERQ